MRARAGPFRQYALAALALAIGNDLIGALTAVTAMCFLLGVVLTRPDATPMPHDAPGCHRNGPEPSRPVSLENGQ